VRRALSYLPWRTLRHAADYTDYDLRALFLQVFKHTDVREYAVFRVLAYGAGVKENYICFFHFIGKFVPVTQQGIRDETRIQLVHLAAESPNVKQLAHYANCTTGLCPSQAIWQLDTQARRRYCLVSTTILRRPAVKTLNLLLVCCLTFSLVSCEEKAPGGDKKAHTAQTTPAGQNTGQKPVNELTPQEQVRIENLIEKLGSEDTAVSNDAVSELAEIGRPAVPFLLDALGYVDENTRMHSAWLLARIGAITDIKPLIEALKDGNSYVRANACHALATVESKTTIGPLVEALKDSQSDVRCAAAEALGYITDMDDTKAVEALLVTLDDKDWYVRVCAAWAFGEIGHLSAVPKLIGLLKDDKWRVREAAAETLGWMADPKAIPALVKLLDDRNWNVRLCTIWSLGHIGDEKAIPYLVEMLKQDNWRLAAKARKSLRKITAEDFGTDYGKWIDWYNKNK
jgi:HEAT repeat protein